MDLATIVGLIGALALIIISMLMSGELAMFVNGPSVVIVVGGSIFAVMAKYGLGQFLGAFKVAAKSFSTKLPNPNELIDEVVSLADEARKGGLLSLEGREVSSDFLQKGIQLLVDGHDPDVVKALLSKDKNQAQERHSTGASIFSAPLKSRFLSVSSINFFVIKVCATEALQELIISIFLCPNSSI